MGPACQQRRHEKINSLFGLVTSFELRIEHSEVVIAFTHGVDIRLIYVS
jgi:hypothetical protein